MTHHAKISTGPAITDRPTSAGEWEYKGDAARFVDACGHATTGYWFWCYQWVNVLVTETPGAGRLCRELNMGGSIHCGLAPWSGQWRRVGSARKNNRKP